MSHRLITIQAPGRVVNGDVQLPFSPDDPGRYMRRRPANFGDYVVVDSMLRVVDYESAANLQFSSSGGDVPESPDPDADLVVIRGANYLRENLDLTGLGELIKRLGLPCVVMGIGAQAPSYRPLSLSDGTKNAMRILSDHCQVVGTRGEFSADLLQEIGVSNSQPVGCPSLFRQQREDVKIPTPMKESVDSIAFNMNRHMTGIYGEDRIRINRYQRKMFIDIVERANRVGTFCQGEPAEFVAAHELDDAYHSVKQDLSAWGFLDGPDDPLFGKFVEAAISPASVGEWERRILAFDFVIGMRFHGNTVALSNGRPAVYLVNDTRVQELAEYFAIPYADLRGVTAPPDVSELIEAADFSAFNRTFPVRYRRFAEYLDSNGVAHRLAHASPEHIPAAALGSPVIESELRGDSLLGWLQAESKWGSARVEQLQRKVRQLTDQLKAVSAERDELRERVDPR